LELRNYKGRAFPFFAQNFVGYSAGSVFPYLLAIGVGLLYSLTARFVLGQELVNANGLLTASFLLATLLAIGAATAHFVPEGSKWWRLVWAPFFAVMSGPAMC